MLNNTYATRLNLFVVKRKTAFQENRIKLNSLVFKGPAVKNHSDGESFEKKSVVRKTKNVVSQIICGLIMFRLTALTEKALYEI